MIVYLSLLVALVGVVMYFACANAKAAECGRLMFACGVLAFLLKAGEPLLRLLG